jgi:hypothetical protein
MTRFLMIAGAAAVLALPVAAPAYACGAHAKTAEATSVDLAAAAKKALAPASQDKTDAAQKAPAK